MRLTQRGVQLGDLGLQLLLAGGRPGRPRAGTDNQCFRYDYLQRLTDAWAQGTATCATDPATATLGGPAPYRVNYTHDVTGNRKSETQYANGGVVTTGRAYKYAGVRRPELSGQRPHYDGVPER